jgi:titin
LSGYTVTCTPSCTIANQPAANATSLTVTGLSAGTNYSFSIVANASDSQNSSAATASARTAYAAPGAVTGVTATGSGMTQMQLNWLAPVLVGSGLSGYTVTCTPSCTIANQPGANATGLLITGLTPNTSYVFNVVAKASDTQSSLSASSSSVSTASAPGQLVNASNSVTTTTATISWTAPIGSGSLIVGYVVTCSPTCGSAQALSGSATSVTLTGLTPNTPYVVSIMAQAQSGNTTTTVNLSTAKSAPGAVTGLTATAQSTSSVLLNWTAAAANGSASLSGYTVTCTPSCTIANQPAANATSLTVTGLLGGTNYSFSIVANASDSQDSLAATASARTVAYTAPGAVTGVTATATAANSVTLSWTAPQNVGAGVVGYFVTCSPACSISNPVAAQLSSVIITGLTGGSSYTFTILTQDSNGQYSTAASASTTTPFGAPGAVTGVTATQPSMGTVILRWKAPVNVGAGITSYKITYIQNGKTITKVVTGLTTSLSGLTKVKHVFSIVANARNGASSTTSTVSLVVR